MSGGLPSLLLVCALLLAVASTEDQGALHGSSATTNYASSYLGAKIVDHHSKAKGVYNLLNDDSDKYMIIPCKEGRKQFTVQLSREVELSIIAISNQEYFSSGTKNFTLLGSNRYPCQHPACMWRVLGSFRAEFTRTTQRFIIAKQQPVKFLRFQWVTHHGHEKSCTMTSLHAYGTDMLETLAAELNNPDSTVDEDAEEEMVTGRTETQYVEQEEEAEAPNVTSTAANTTTSPFDTAQTSQPEQPVVLKKKWKPVPVVFPPRNSSTSLLKQCLFVDKATEVFYELGPGARCYKRKEQKQQKDKVTAPNILALPHMQRQLRSMQQEVNRLQKLLISVENSNHILSKRVDALLAQMTKEDRAHQAAIDALTKMHEVQSYQQRVLSTQWELKFSDSVESLSGLQGFDAVWWWVVGSNIFLVMLLVLTCYAKTVQGAMNHGGGQGVEQLAKPRMFPLSSSATNLATFSGLDDTGEGDVDGDGESPMEEEAVLKTDT